MISKAKKPGASRMLADLESEGRPKGTMQFSCYCRLIAEIGFNKADL
jgi:hypothetical protein